MNLNSLLTILGLKSHSFRKMTFNELSELYVSMMLRSLAMSMSGIFIPIFLYQQGYKIWQILLFYFVTFGAQYIFAIPAARTVAKIGPKHTILISYVLQVFTLLGLVFLAGTPDTFLLLAALLGVANIAFFTSFHIDFSKVKHSKTGGSELGIAYLGERFGAVMGPAVGGVVAFIFSPKYIFVAAIIVLLSAVIPLFITKEPTRLNQKLIYRNFSLHKIKADITSYSFFTVEIAITMIIWPLFLGVFVFDTDPYLQIGGITSISIIVSLIIARVYGKLIDNSQGRNLLRFTAVSNAVLHMFRVFTNGFIPALGINLVNEAITPGYRMATFKGMYDAADSFPGHRIVYISIMEVFSTMARMLFFGLGTIAAYNFETGKPFFAVLFTIGAICSLLMMLERYPALYSRKFRLWPR